MRPVGFEPTTHRSSAYCSPRLSYGPINLSSVGFEPTTPRLRALCSSQAELRALILNELEGIRTPDTWVKSPVL